VRENGFSSSTATSLKSFFDDEFLHDHVEQFFKTAPYPSYKFFFLLFWIIIDIAIYIILRTCVRWTTDNIRLHDRV